MEGHGQDPAVDGATTRYTVTTHDAGLGTVVTGGASGDAQPAPAHAVGVASWQSITTAPRGSAENGPQDTRHVDYVAPPDLLLFTAEGKLCVGSWDAYYAEGGAGYDGGSAWQESMSGERIYPTHWMLLPEPPQ